MKSRKNAFKVLLTGLIVAAVCVTNFADADEPNMTAQNDTAKSVIVHDFSWPACGGFCRP